MSKFLNYDEFKDLVYINRVVIAKTTCDWQPNKDIDEVIRSGTKIKFCIVWNKLSSIKHHIEAERQEQFKYDVDIEWHDDWTRYPGQFELEEDDAICKSDGKTWDNLEVGWTLIDKDGDERKIQEILGKMVFVSEPNNFEASDSYFMASEFEVMGWKIKGASEEKLSIGDAIEWINNLTGIDKQIKNQTVEMLKKLK